MKSHNLTKWNNFHWHPPPKKKEKKKEKERKKAKSCEATQPSSCPGLKKLYELHV